MNAISFYVTKRECSVLVAIQIIPEEDKTFSGFIFANSIFYQSKYIKYVTVKRSYKNCQKRVVIFLNGVCLRDTLVVQIKHLWGEISCVRPYFYNIIM